MPPAYESVPTSEAPAHNALKDMILSDNMHPVGGRRCAQLRCLGFFSLPGIPPSACPLQYYHFGPSGPDLFFIG